MKKRRLGNSELFVSEIGLGCMSLPTNAAESKKIIDVALESGINYFDTADLYDQGLNEELLGAAIRQKRADIILATKVGNVWNEDGQGWHWDPSKKNIHAQVKNSLQRLGTDYIDLYQLHGGTASDPWDEIIDAFEELKKEGVIRAYGISSIRPNVIKRFLTDSSAVSVMMQYSILDRRPEEWFSFIDEHEVSVVARGSLAKGLLTADWQRRSGKANGYGSYDKESLTHTLAGLNREFGDLHAAAIAYVLSHKTIASAVIGASSVLQLQASIQAYQLAQQMEKAHDIAQSTRLDNYEDHRD